MNQTPDEQPAGSEDTESEQALPLEVAPPPPKGPAFVVTALDYAPPDTVRQRSAGDEIVSFILGMMAPFLVGVVALVATRQAAALVRAG